MTSPHTSTLLESIIIPARLIFFMWLAAFIEITYGLELGYLGIVPRDWFGLIGLFAAPLVHSGYLHLVSNTIPLLFLGFLLFFFYSRIGKAVLFRAYFWTNALVWLFGRKGTIHIGASGVVYSIAFFLIFFGLFRRDFKSLFISIIILLLYGGIFYGVLPTDSRVSWESHFAGALVGIFTAIHFSKKKKV